MIFSKEFFITEKMPFCEQKQIKEDLYFREFTTTLRPFVFNI